MKRPLKCSLGGASPVRPARISAFAGRLAVVLAFTAFAPANLFACAACYGKVDAPMADGMNWAILTLGVVLATVLGAFLTFLIYAIRKSETVEAARKQRLAAPVKAGAC